MNSILVTGLKKCCVQLLAKNTGTQQQPVRYTGRRDCNNKDLGPRCTKEKLAGSPCMERKRKSTERAAKTPFKSMWDNPECCRDPCPDVFPRFDELYYKPSDKAKRKYKRTWVECPDLVIKPKKICCYEKLGMLPIERRKRKDRPKTACVPGDCPKGRKNLKCLTINMPGCSPGRIPPKCHIIREKTDCKKVCCPYPAFSECKRPKLTKGRSVECDCLRPRSQCSMFEYLRVQSMQKKVKKN